MAAMPWNKLNTRSSPPPDHSILYPPPPPPAMEEVNQNLPPNPLSPTAIPHVGGSI